MDEKVIAERLVLCRALGFNANFVRDFLAIIVDAGSNSCAIPFK